MNLGLKIKKLRQSNDMTQEEFGEMLGLSPKAVSRWENSITYPDILLLPVIANIFNVSTDELLEVDELRVKENIAKTLKEVEDLGSNYNKALIILKEAKKKYPNNYQILDKYLFYLMGGIADNDKAILLENKDEINRTSDVILKGCLDEKIRLQALNYKAKLLYALEDEAAALDILNNFPSIYHSSNQKKEQLYPKESNKFYKYLLENIEELSSFLGNKLAKAIIYNKDFKKQDITNKCDKFYELFKTKDDLDVSFMKTIAKGFFTEIKNRASQLKLDEKILIKLEEYNKEFSC